MMHPFYNKHFKIELSREYRSYPFEHSCIFVAYNSEIQGISSFFGCGVPKDTYISIDSKELMYITKKGGRVTYESIYKLGEHVRDSYNTPRPGFGKMGDVARDVMIYNGTWGMSIPISKLGYGDRVMCLFLMWALKGINLYWGIRKKIVENYVKQVICQPWKE